MGRKGTSKRKTPKTKGPPEKAGSTISMVSSLTSDSGTPRVVAKEEVSSAGKTGKRQASGSNSKNKRR